MQPDTLRQWEAKLKSKLQLKRKVPPSVGSAKDKADRVKYRQKLAERRTAWRKTHAITTDPRAVSGAVKTAWRPEKPRTP